MRDSPKRLNPEVSLKEALLSYAPAQHRRLLLAVSGGCDSMALLGASWALQQTLDLHLQAAHLIHHPKSAQARARADLVSDYCRKTGIPLTVERLARTVQKGESPEEQMRRERYQFLEETAQKLACDWILTAHHADDQAETILFRILMGTGLRGLAGIPERRGLVLRPFLKLHKADLQSYCLNHAIFFAEDPANLDMRRPRNRIRHEILPLIQETLNPEAVAALARLGQWAAEANEVVAAQTERCWKECWREFAPKTASFPKGKIVLDIDAILPYFITLRKNVLLKALSLAADQEMAVDALDLERAESFLHGKRTGAIFKLPQGPTILRHGRQLIITATTAAAFQYRLVPGQDRQLPKLGMLAVWGKIASKPLAVGDGLVADLDLKLVKGELTLGLASEGDRFHPLGAPGEKRLFRFLTDRGVSRWDKRQTWVLRQNGEIIWVVGQRISEKVRVREITKATWRLRLQPLE